MLGPQGKSGHGPFADVLHMQGSTDRKHKALRERRTQRIVDACTMDGGRTLSAFADRRTGRRALPDSEGQ